MFDLKSLSIFSVKALSTTIIVLGVLMGYQGKILGFSSMMVGCSLIGQSASQSLRVKS